MEQNESKNSLIAEYYSAHYDELKSFVASRLLPADESEDIVQTIFVRLLQMDGMITPVTLPCFVYTIARNLICDYWRHKRRVDEFEHIVRKGDWCARYADDVETIYSAHEVEAYLERSMAKLTQKQSRIYRLNIYDGMKVSDIAEYLSLNYKSVERSLGLARKEVRYNIRKVLAS